MKKLLILITIITLSSCSNTTFKVENQFKETTIALQNSNALDTNLYKVIKVKDKLYIINSKTKLVEQKCTNESGAVLTLIIFCICTIIASAIISITYW